MSDETVDQYIYRVCRNKDIGKYDMTWNEVGDLLNQELENDYGESKYRKEYQAMQRGIDLTYKQEADIEGYLEELKLEKLELEMKRKKVQTDSVYYNRVLRTQARRDMLFEKVSDAIKSVELDVPNFEPLQVTQAGQEWLLGISDIHAYKYFKSITNEYNKDILEDRMLDLISQVKYEIERNNISKLHIINNGDNFEGMLRKSALQYLEMGVIDTVLEFQRWMLEWLTELSRYVEIEYIHLTSANHSEIRPLGSNAGEFPAEDLEKIIANYLYDMTKDNERIKVIVPKDSYYIFKLAGYNILAHHGHGIRNATRYVEKMTRKLRVFIDYAVFGHLHHSVIETIDEGHDNDCEIIRLPSVMGTDQYADSILRGAKAGALLLRFEEGKGRNQENKFILN